MVSEMLISMFKILVVLPFQLTAFDEHCQNLGTNLPPKLKKSTFVIIHLRG